MNLPQRRISQIHTCSTECGLVGVAETMQPTQGFEGQPETEITRPGSSAVNWNYRSLSLCTNAGFFYMARSLDHSLHNSKWTRCAARRRLGFVWSWRSRASLRRLTCSAAPDLDICDGSSI